MEDNKKGSSRRQVLKLGVYGLGAVGAMGLAGGANAQVAKKAAQSAVKYQQSPNNGRSCSQCQHFIAPGSCRIVDGAINPSGFCIMFAKKG
jgi:hypothetical protein